MVRLLLRPPECPDPHNTAPINHCLPLELPFPHEASFGLKPIQTPLKPDATFSSFTKMELVVLIVQVRSVPRDLWIQDTRQNAYHSKVSSHVLHLP